LRSNTKKKKRSARSMPRKKRGRVCGFESREKIIGRKGAIANPPKNNSARSPFEGKRRFGYGHRCRRGGREKEKKRKKRIGRKKRKKATEIG